MDLPRNPLCACHFRCGIVAMWMAAKCLVGEAEIPSVEDIQRRAIDLKFSANGEMFRHLQHQQHFLAYNFTGSY